MEYLKKAVLFPVNAGLSLVGHVGKLVTNGSDVGGDFNTDVTQGEYTAALQALKWSQLAYTLTTEQTKTAEFANWYLESDTNSDAQSIVGLVGSTVVVAWRGTESVKDAMADLRIMQTTDPDFSGEIHRGFEAQFVSEEGPTTTAVKRLFAENKIENIVVTGHSLGGALATLYTVKMLKLYPELDTKLITFGCPRVGDKVFADAANKTFSRKGKNIHNRWAHNNDLVTRMPLEIDYRHTGRFCYLGDDGVAKISENSEADISWSRTFDDRFTAWTTTGFGSDLGDHRCHSYQQALDAVGAKCNW